MARELEEERAVGTEGKLRAAAGVGCAGGFVRLGGGGAGGIGGEGAGGARGTGVMRAAVVLAGSHNGERYYN